MFFNSPAVVVRAKRNILELYLPPKNQFYKLKIPQNVVSFLDVIDADYFVKYVMDFLIKLNTKSAKVDLLMDSEVVFEKTIPKTNDESDKIAIEEFFSNIPLDSDNVSKKTYFSNNKYFLFATNKAYYNSIIKAFSNCGWRVNYVAPANIFGFNAQNKVLDGENLKSILQNTKLALKINFLEVSKPNSK